MDCFAEPVIGRRFTPTRWLAMTANFYEDFHPMPVPQHIFDPPFNIIRCSHVVLDVADLNASREFYENTVGLHVEDRDDKAVYLRGSE